MRWKIGQLDPLSRAKLEMVCDQKGLGGEPCYFASSHRARPILIAAAVGMTATALCVAGVQSAADSGNLGAALVMIGFTLVAGLWTLLVILEGCRRSAARIRPFTLVTPKVLVQSDYEHGQLQAYRLGDAESFQSFNEYDRQSFQGRRYDFRFPDGTASVTIPDQEGISRLEQVLELARIPASGCRAGLDLLPDAPTISGTGWRAFTDPFGDFWVLLGTLLGLGVLACVILARAGLI